MGLRVIGSEGIQYNLTSFSSCNWVTQNLSIDKEKKCPSLLKNMIRCKLSMKTCYSVSIIRSVSMAQKFRRISMRLVHGTCDARYQSIKQHSTTSCHFASSRTCMVLFPKDPWDWYIYQVDFFNGKCRLNIYQSHGSLGIWPPMAAFPHLCAAKKAPSARSKSAQRGVPIVPRCSGLFSPWKKACRGQKKHQGEGFFLPSVPFCWSFDLDFLKEIWKKSVVEWNTLGRKRMEMMMEDSNLNCFNIQNDPCFLLESILSSKPADGRDSPPTFFVSVVPLIFGLHSNLLLPSSN